MKKNIHPTSREVAFIDINHPEKIMIFKSTITKTTKKIRIGETEYDAVSLDTSYLTHPFYTGETNYVAKAGRIDRFNEKYKNSNFSISSKINSTEENKEKKS